MTEKRLDSNALTDGGNGAEALTQARMDLATSEQSLAESLEAKEFLQSVLDSSRDCIKVLTLAGDIIFMNDGGKEVMEVDDFEVIRGCAWTGFWEGEDKRAAEAALSAALDGKAGNFQGTAATARGRSKYWDVTVTRIAGREGHDDHILSISRDITAAKEIEQQRELLARELGHRIKNSLAVVQAIAGQTFRDVDRTALKEFNARLTALGAAQDLLLQSAWEHVSVQELIEKTLAPICAPERLSLQIDQLQIDGRKSLALALALHELGTNALKYGALSNDRGSVAISLTKSANDFELIWREISGPPVEAPTITGFGTRLMTRNLEADFEGTVKLNFNPSGVVLTLSAPL